MNTNSDEDITFVAVLQDGDMYVFYHTYAEETEMDIEVLKQMLPVLLYKDVVMPRPQSLDIYTKLKKACTDRHLYITSKAPWPLAQRFTHTFTVRPDKDAVFAIMDEALREKHEAMGKTIESFRKGASQ